MMPLRYALRSSFHDVDPDDAGEEKVEPKQDPSLAAAPGKQAKRCHWHPLACLSLSTEGIGESPSERDKLGCSNPSFLSPTLMRHETTSLLSATKQ